MDTVICRHCLQMVKPRLIQFMAGYIAHCPKCEKLIALVCKHHATEDKEVAVNTSTGKERMVV